MYNFTCFFHTPRTSEYQDALLVALRAVANHATVESLSGKIRLFRHSFCFKHRVANNEVSKLPNAVRTLIILDHNPALLLFCDIYRKNIAGGVHRQVLGGASIRNDGFG